MTRKFIFDTDWFTDCDDCVAFRFLLRSLDENHSLLGVNINATTKYAYASARAFMENEEACYPIATDLPLYESDGVKFQKNMAANSPYSNADAEDSLSFYKRLLEENDEVEILSVGFLSTLERVFKAYPQLVKKVKKLWIMGGNWQEQGTVEYNFGAFLRAVAATRFVVNELEIPKVFLGYEVGCDVRTGGNLSKEDMLGKALYDWGCTARPSWDPMLVLAAFEDKFGKCFGKVFGKARVDEKGANYFDNSNDGQDAYLVKTCEKGYYENLINEIIKE